MKNLLSVSLSLLTIMGGLGLTSVFGAQPLTNTELDSVTAAGSFSIEILPPSAFSAPVAALDPMGGQSVTSNPVSPASPSEMAISPNSPVQPGVGELVDPALLTELPGLFFSFDAGGGTTGSGTAQMPTENPFAPNAPSQPNLTFSGNPISSGNVSRIQNMLLNMNVCVQCRASGHIVQSNNGFVFQIPIQ